MTWKIKQIGKLPKLKNPILIEGLPGIGNVGKVAVDFIIDETKAKKLFSFFSYTFPHSVFVNDDNLVELPSISIYYKKFNNKKKNDLLLLAGDVQPIDETSSYEFTDIVLEICEKLKCKEIITLGGIGLQTIPKKPKVYCTANNREIIKKYKKKCDINDNLYGVVGPIVGVTGLLLGLAKNKNINAIGLLAETFAHPMFLGIKGSKKVLKILNNKLLLNLKFTKLEKEIKEMESEILKRTDDLAKVSKSIKARGKFGKEINYIG